MILETRLENLQRRVYLDAFAPGKLALPTAPSGSSYAAPAIGGVVLLLKQWAKEIGPPASD